MADFNWNDLRAFLAVGVVLFHYQLQWDPALGFSPIIERSRLAVAQQAW